MTWLTPDPNTPRQPQGRCESSTDEVLEACGTDDRWNDDLAPPARGRSLR